MSPQMQVYCASRTKDGKQVRGMGSHGSSMQNLMGLENHQCKSPFGRLPGEWPSGAGLNTFVGLMCSLPVRQLIPSPDISNGQLPLQNE